MVQNRYDRLILELAEVRTKHNEMEMHISTT